MPDEGPAEGGVTAASVDSEDQPWASDRAYEDDGHVGESTAAGDLDPLWEHDNVQLVSVGVDIGSSGTQVVFSRLHLRRRSENLSSRYVLVQRDVLYRSPVRFTPFIRGQDIDGDQLGRFLDESYAAARLRPGDIDAGVVLLTGEALRRRNAERIANVVAERAGDLVCASAGHHMESLLAGYGSGAARLSRDTGQRLLNIDVGGGTTKLALIESGVIVRTAALAIGGRLIAVGQEGRIERLEPAGAKHATRAGVDCVVGGRVTSEQLAAVADGMAAALAAALRPRAEPALTRDLWLTDPIGSVDDLDGVIFSGGVAEYVYEREPRDLGDLGWPLGVALRSLLASGGFPAPLLGPGECIRATVLGASQYSLQVSGDTVHISDASALLPRRNLQVLRPYRSLPEDVDAVVLGAAIHDQLTAFERLDDDDDLALLLPWSGLPTHARLRSLAEAVVSGMEPRIERGLPLYLVLDADVGFSLGRILGEELALGTGLVVIDGLDLRELDFVDLGSPRRPSDVVPVTIKSLVFDGHSGGIGIMD